MKGITPVIATILLLLITISMVGFAFVWFSGMLSNVATTSENATNQQMIQMNQKIAIESAKSGNIAVRNVGTYNINYTALSLYISGGVKSVGIGYAGLGGTDCNWSTAALLSPNGILVANCTCVPGNSIKVTAPGGSDTDTCIS